MTDVYDVHTMQQIARIAANYLTGETNYETALSELSRWMTYGEARNVLTRALENADG